MKKKYTLKDIKKTRDFSNYSLNVKPTMKLAPYISWFFIRFLPFITPNQISFLWEIIMLVGFFIMALGGYWNFLAGILIYHLGFMFDSVDGDIARTIKKTTLGGVYLDKLFSWINRSLMLFALGIGLYNLTGKVMYFYLGLWCCFILLIDNLNRLKVYETFVNQGRIDLLKKSSKIEKEKCKISRKNKEGLLKLYIVDFFRPTSPFTLMFFAILFNLADYYLIFMAILVLVIFVKNFISIYRRIGNIPS